MIWDYEEIETIAIVAEALELSPWMCFLKASLF